MSAETNDWNITISDVIRIVADEGDTLLVTLPPMSTELPTNELDRMFERVAHGFKEAFNDKDVKVIVVPHGMDVQLIKSSELTDK